MVKNMIEKNLCGMTFAPFVGSGRLNTQQAREKSENNERTALCKFCDFGTKRCAGNTAIRNDLLYIKGNDDR